MKLLDRETYITNIPSEISLLLDHCHEFLEDEDGIVSPECGMALAYFAERVQFYYDKRKAQFGFEHLKLRKLMGEAERLLMIRAEFCHFKKMAEDEASPE